MKEATQTKRQETLMLCLMKGRIRVLLGKGGVSVIAENGLAIMAAVIIIALVLFA